MNSFSCLSSLFLLLNYILLLTYISLLWITLDSHLHRLGFAAQARANLSYFLVLFSLFSLELALEITINVIYLYQWHYFDFPYVEYGAIVEITGIWINAACWINDFYNSTAFLHSITQFTYNKLSYYQHLSWTLQIINAVHHHLSHSFKDFFSKCDQIRWKLRKWSHLLKKALMKNFIFRALQHA